MLTTETHSISTNTEDSLRVVIIEDLRDIRESLAALINGTHGFRCVAAFGSVETALVRIKNERPEVILTDLGLPGMSGIEGIERFRQMFPDVPIIALTIYDNDDQIFNALCAGANGYLLKNTPPARLLESLREAYEGGAPMSPNIATRVVNLFREFRPPNHADYRLTPQETELLRLLIEGHHKKTAAREMNISFHTVSFHLKNIYEKLQVHSKSEAVAKALREHLV
ncbi:MAG: response regulator transcription factor [Pyrinomonadaceae bacterium]